MMYCMTTGHFKVRGKHGKARRSVTALVAAQRLAEEVVDLEERLLRARSNELRAQKESAAAAKAARKAQSAAQHATLDRGGLQSIIDTLQVAPLI